MGAIARGLVDNLARVRVDAVRRFGLRGDRVRLAVRAHLLARLGRG